MTTMMQLFQATVDSRGYQQALGVIRDGRVAWYSWQELAELVQSRVAELVRQGVESGDRVVHLGENSLAWITNDLAIQDLGAVHVPLSTKLSPAQQQRFIEHCGAVYRLESGNSVNQLQPTGLLRTKVAGIATSESLATILYTSGTTGPPRGVMLTQQNLVSNTVATSQAVGATQELRLVILPFSHIYARTCDLYSWVHRGSQLVLGRGRETFLDDCQLVQPRVINAVPYLYQKLVDWADSGAAGEVTSLRQLLGGNIGRCYCGGAPLAPAVVERFAAEELPLLPGYGLTEASPVVTISSRDEYAPTTVGRPLANLDVLLAEDGEILVRGPSVMAGYWQAPEETAEVLSNGWLHTGDLGAWDEAGRLSIIGRKKEMIALSTGMKVSPGPLEAALVASPWIEQAMVVGEGQRFLTALLVPNPQKVRGMIRERRLWVWSKRRAVSHPQIRERVEEEIQRCLKPFAAHEQVARFCLLPRGFSMAAGEMTAKLSLCRPVIEQRFARQIARLYK